MPVPTKRRWTTKGGRAAEAWRVKYRDAAGLQRQKQFRTKREANAFVESLSERRAASAAAVPAPPCAAVAERVGLHEAAGRWLEQGRRGRDGRPPLERKTLEEYAYLLGYVRRAAPDVPLAAVDKAFLAAARERLLREAPSRDLAVRVWRTALLPTLAFARAVGWMRHDPGREVTIHRDRRAEDPGGRVEVHTPEEMRAVLAAAVARSGHRRRDVSRSWARLSPLLHLLVYTGLRSSELRGLPPDAIDLGARTLRVRQRADEAGRIGPPKSRHAYRTLTLPEPLIPILGDWLGTLQSGTRLVFPARDGDPLTLAYLRSRMWEPVQREAGLPYRNLHAARHFYASRLVAAGATPLELQRALGHHDAAFTLRTYGHLFGGAEAERRRAALVEAVVL